MSMSAQIERGSRAETVGRVLDRLGTPVWLVNPSAATIRVATRTLEDRPLEGSAVIARYEALRGIRDRFEIATELAELTAEGLELIVFDEPPEASLVVGTDAYYTLVPTDDELLAVRDTTASVRTYADGLRRTGEEFPLRTPPLATVRETMTEAFGPAFREEFDATLAAVERRDDTVELSNLLLVLGARHGVLLYDLSRWGEDAGVASRATFSRHKTRLEDRGLLDTENAPTEFGRPRQRLVPGSDAVRDAAPAALVDLLADD